MSNNPLSNFTDEQLITELMDRNKVVEAPFRTERYTRYYQVIIGLGKDSTATLEIPADGLNHLESAAAQAELAGA